MIKWQILIPNFPFSLHLLFISQQVFLLLIALPHSPFLLLVISLSCGRTWNIFHHKTKLFPYLLSSQHKNTPQPLWKLGAAIWLSSRSEKRYFQVWPIEVVMSFSALFSPLTGWMYKTQRTRRRVDSKPSMKGGWVLEHFVDTSIELYVTKIEFLFPTKNRDYFYIN